MKTITAQVYGLNDATCGQIIERRLSALPGVMRAEASYVSQTVTIAFDEGQIREDGLRDLIKDCGFLCGEPMTVEQMLRSTAQRPSSAAPSAAPSATAGHEHVEGGAAHDMGGMGGMGGMHDMSDPAMARAM